MTAASAYPPGSDQGFSEGRASEPSMEDILASIRRIIADDQQANGSRLGGRRAQPAGAAVASPAEPAVPPVSAARDEVLDLARYSPPIHDMATDHHDQTPEVPAAAPEPHMAETSYGQPAGSEPEAYAHQPEVPSPGAFEAAEVDDATEGSRDLSLLAAPMSESVMSAFEALAATVVLENKPMLEGILRDLLRPMLKTWLDDNLPGLVERLVRVEIERVARGGRG